MKNTILVFTISILAVTGCSYGENISIHDQKNNEKNVLDLYRQYSTYTDPGEYVYVYKDLPDSLQELCRLIRSQFMHPYAELPKYRHLIPQERWNESFKYSTVRSILEGLLSHDSSGLVNNRKPEDRLILGCRDYAVLLASILKYRGIPARVRYGHASYLNPGFHLSHTICEVWNENDKRWMLVDPSMDMVDFNREKFDFSNDLWLKMQRDEIDPELYGNPGQYSGLVSILGKVCHDLASILGTEHTIYHYAPILEYAFENDSRLTDDHRATLNRISELMRSIDAVNLSKLQEIYNSTPYIQVTRTFDPEKKAENKSNSAGI